MLTAREDTTGVHTTPSLSVNDSATEMRSENFAASLANGTSPAAARILFLFTICTVPNPSMRKDDWVLAPLKSVSITIALRLSTEVLDGISTSSGRLAIT